MGPERNSWTDRYRRPQGFGMRSLCSPLDRYIEDLDSMRFLVQKGRGSLCYVPPEGDGAGPGDGPGAGEVARQAHTCATFETEPVQCFGR